MGLDMYLYAERRFPPSSDGARNVMSAAGTDLSYLKRGVLHLPVQLVMARGRTRTPGLSGQARRGWAR